MTNRDKAQLFLGIAILCVVLAIVVPLGLASAYALGSDSSCGSIEERAKYGNVDELKETCDEENAKEQRNIALGFGVFILPAIGFGVASRVMAKKAD